MKPRKEGRHKYFMLNGRSAAKVIESLMGFATSKGQLRTRTGPRDVELRKARVCYNHLAGEAGIRMYESLLKRRFLHLDDNGLSLSRKGYTFATDLGINIAELASGRTSLCRQCLDWSECKSHLAGSLGRALFDTLQRRGIVKRDKTSRVVHFGPRGPQAFEKLFPLKAP